MRYNNIFEAEANSIRLPWLEIRAMDTTSRAFEWLIAELATIVYSLPAGTAPLGRPGQKQYGLDMRAIDRDGVVVGAQAKLEKPASTNDAALRKLKKWVENDYWTAVNKNDQGRKFMVQRLVVAVPWAPDVHQQQYFISPDKPWGEGEDGPQLILWNREILETLISPYPELISRYFGAHHAARSVEYRGSIQAAALKQGVDLYFSISDATQRADETAESGDPHAAAVKLNEVEQRLRAFGFHVDADRLTARVTKYYKDFNFEPLVALRLISDVIKWIDRSSISGIDRSIRGAHDSDFDGFPGIALILRQCLIDFNLRQEEIDAILGRSSQIVGASIEHLTVILLEIAMASGNRDLAEYITQRIPMTPPEAPDLRSRWTALQIDIGAISWTPPPIGNRPREQWLAYSRQGQRLHEKACRSDLNSDHTAHCEGAFFAYKTAAELALGAGMQDEAFWSLYNAEIASLAVEDPSINRLGDQISSLRLGLYLDGSRASRSSMQIGSLAFLDRLERRHAERTSAEACALAALDAYRLGDIEAYRDALSAMALAKLDEANSESDEHLAGHALRLAVLAGDSSTATRVADTFPSIRLRDGWLNNVSVGTIRAAASALGRLHPTADEELTDRYIEPISQLLTAGSRPLLGDPREIALLALARLGAGFSPSGLEQVRDIIGQITPRTDKERAAYLEAVAWIYRRSELPTEQIDTLLMPVAKHSGVAALRGIIRERIERFGHPASTSPIHPLAVQIFHEGYADEVADQILSVTAPVNQGRKLLASFPPLNKDDVTSWSSERTDEVWSHLCAIASNPALLPKSRQTAIRFLGFIRLHSDTISSQQIRVASTALTALLEEVRSGQIEEWSHGKAALPILIRELGSLIDEECLDDVRDYLETALYSSDDELSLDAGQMLVNLAHFGIVVFDSKSLQRHTRVEIRRAAVAVALAECEPEGEVIAKLATDESARVRMELAVHGTALRGKFAESVESLRTDHDARVRWIVDDEWWQCSDH